MWRELIVITSLLFYGCGETALDSYNSGKENSFSPAEYIILIPSNPPFIEFNDSNIGVTDDLTYEEDVEFPTEPIPQVPDIL
jgi:hypothetical protein